MSLNDTPSAQRTHIGFFGCRNAGKSSLVNAVTGQALSIVSAVKGTTTDPVTKAMELLPLGPVVVIDTPGFDDEGNLGELRVKRAKDALNRSDVAVLVVDGTLGLRPEDAQLLELINDRGLPHMIAWNKVNPSNFRRFIFLVFKRIQIFLHQIFHDLLLAASISVYAVEKGQRGHRTKQHIIQINIILRRNFKKIIIIFLAIFLALFIRDLSFTF